MRYMFIIVCAILLSSLSSFASCTDLISELKSMREAQSSIQMSLISNHAMFASTLESYSEALSQSGGKVHRVVSSNMSSSADSFRNRGLRAQKTALKLDEATDDLIQRLTKCLK